MGLFAEDAPWTPPELAPELVRKLATGRYDALAGRYLHAEHDDVDELLARIDEVRERDLNAIRLRESKGLGSVGSPDGWAFTWAERKRRQSRCRRRLHRAPGLR